jgi:hypothetical protein
MRSDHHNSERPSLVARILAALAVTALFAAPALAEKVTLGYSFTGLEDLGPGWSYEGWLIVAGAPVTTGTFTVGASGMPSQHIFAAEVTDRAAITAFVLTIEPAPDSDPAPSAVHLLGGDFSGARAMLSVSHPAALGSDFTAAAGGYILAAPTGGGLASYRNGIWFVDPAAGPGPSLSLPALPAGWVYEGWVAGASGPMTTGRFTSPTGADSDGGGPAAGPAAPPLFPGQDFINPPTDLTASYAAVVSIEPEPDNSPAPFALKPLVDMIIDDVGMGVLQPLGNNAAGFLNGSVTLLDEWFVPNVAHAKGAGGSMWRSDLDVHNAGMTATSFQITLLADGMMVDKTYTLGAGQAMRYVDVVGGLFGYQGVAALRLLVDGQAVQVAARTYNESSRGTMGQTIGAMAMANAATYQRTRRVLGLSHAALRSAGFRTNLGLLNVSDQAATVTVEFHRADGSMVGSVDAGLDAMEQMQLNDVLARLSDEDVPVAYAVVRVHEAGAYVLGYASVVDNRTNAPAYFAAR